jgi:glycerol uptake facilitator-like aquaporin
MRRLLAGALFAAFTTFVVALALRAPDATIALLAAAGATVMVTWFAGQHSTEDESGLALANPAWTVALTLVGRSSGAFVLPLIAAQVVGGIAGGLGALVLEDRLGDTLVWNTPSVVATGVVVLVLGIAATWLLFAIDARISEAYAGIPTLLAGAALPAGLGALLNPAAALGLATADLIPWDVASAAIIAAALAAVAGAYTTAVISPTD